MVEEEDSSDGVLQQPGVGGREDAPSWGRFLIVEEDLRASLVSAMSREGKPRGDHMIEAYRMLAVHARAATDENDRQLGEVYDCAARCIENETRMFEGLCAIIRPLLTDGAARVHSEADPSNGLNPDPSRHLPHQG
jgi:hypothetical protein